jgi:rod shape-determining protein MreC
MKSLLRRYRSTIVSFVALTLPLFLLYVHGSKKREDSTVLETGLATLTGPAQRLMNGVVDAVGGVWHDYIALVDVKQENAGLKQRLAELEGQALENRKLRLENERLGGLCEFKRARSDLGTIPAHVVSKDISPFYRVVRAVLDVGEEDRVRRGMPVITHRGVVGRVAKVTGRYADIMLTVDPRSRVDVTIVARGVNGTLEGRGDRNDFGARFFFLHRGEPIGKDDEVVTSGNDRVFPPGLVVGYIGGSEERQAGVYFEYDVVPAVNFATLEEVLVVVSERQEIPDFDEKRARQ